MPPTTILIIGGGLAGLALGQGLKQAGINFHIFERDEAATFRAQGYRIRISEDKGGNGLRRLLPPALFQAFEETCSTVVKGGHSLDAMTGETRTGGRTPPPQPSKTWNADRQVLRQLLLIGLEEHISYGKRFSRYELVDQGTKAYFEDGSMVEGSMIIGADGVWSRVRRQMLPDFVLLDTAGRAVFGKTLIDKHTFDGVPAVLEQGISLTWADEEPRMKLFCDVMRFHPNEVQAESPATAIRLPQDYIYWVLVFNADCVDESDSELSRLTNAESAALADRLTSHWHSSVRAIVSKQLAGEASTLFFNMGLPHESWKTDPRVTLIGDAGHPMPPVGGVGANVAFEDAAELLDVLKRPDDTEALANFEESLRRKSKEAVQMSAMGGKHFFGMKDVDQFQAVSRYS